MKTKNFKSSIANAVDVKEILKGAPSAFRFKRQSNSNKPVVLIMSSYTPRQCGIATYTQDLVNALNKGFEASFQLDICALDSSQERHNYLQPVNYVLNTDDSSGFVKLAGKLNADSSLQLILIQHEFGLFDKTGDDLVKLIRIIKKPVIVTFHTVLPVPDVFLKLKVQELAIAATRIVVMTNTSAKILVKDYNIDRNKIVVIPHGTHLVVHSSKKKLKEKYKLSGRVVLSTFGLLSSGKSIETTLEALPSIIKKHPEVLFLVIGKTHPTVLKREGELYRSGLELKVKELGLKKHVKFINQFMPLADLLEYLQLTDIYLFTSKDPNQAVSGTFSYAYSCGCPIISTPIPHAIEVLKDTDSVIIDFKSASQLSAGVNRLLSKNAVSCSPAISHSMASTAWENVAISHALLFESIAAPSVPLFYKRPPLLLNHIKRITTSFGAIQFSVINEPAIESGYTLDDNARALISFCQHYQLTKDLSDIGYIGIYLRFMHYCQQSDGMFLNYVNKKKMFTGQNLENNLADANGRAIWALGYFLSVKDILPAYLKQLAVTMMDKALSSMMHIKSPRAMAFIIKGLYYRNSLVEHKEGITIMRQLADRLVQMYRHESKEDWFWYESYLTYANSVMPEAMLCAWLATNNVEYQHIAKKSFDFLLSCTFKPTRISVISNKGWLFNKEGFILNEMGGEQPIDVAYSIIALKKFYTVFSSIDYLRKMELAFNWFLGVNHLRQTIYNPCTGGCYDGLEEYYVNLNQGAESTVSYLMARMAVENLPDSGRLEFAVNPAAEMLAANF
ncbi:MAG: hypothetical protein RLZZ316_2791 [Bacteroidota bacterium]